MKAAYQALIMFVAWVFVSWLINNPLNVIGHIIITFCIINIIKNVLVKTNLH
jgi:hypothetical protein